MTEKYTANREGLIKKLAYFNDFKEDIDGAIFEFSLLCISNMYKIQNPYDIINKEISNNSEMWTPRHIQYYIVWNTTGKNYREVAEFFKATNPDLSIADVASICRWVNIIKAALKRPNSDVAIKVNALKEKVDKYKEILKKELHG